jgi:two-component system response regulator HydG
MNAVERGVVMAQTPYLDTKDLTLIPDGSSSEEKFPVKETIAGDLPLEEVEKATILNVLEASGGNKSETARKLGITRKTLLAKLRKYGAEK